MLQPDFSNTLKIYINDLLAGGGRRALTNIRCGYNEIERDYFCAVDTVAMPNDPAPRQWATYEDMINGRNIELTFFRSNSTITTIIARIYT